MKELPKAYDPKEVEERIYRSWEEGGYFTPHIRPGEEPFVIIMPPPNVTGELHLGHALTATLEDIMVRWHRMKGEPALWLPGTDHAGIATQVVVEKELAKRVLDRHTLGRERFLEEVWAWVRKYGKTISQQHRRLGASCDWSRERFTLDEGPSLAVRSTFVRLYHKGLIYRGERIINWCPRCTTALSDLEVEHKEVSGFLYYISYPLEGQPGKFIAVATTRPETMLGDTAVAVHPDDVRYKGLLGREAVLPVLGRFIPIIADEAVDPKFGTGAVKVTPAHDPVDFEVAQRHGLPSVKVINPDATMNENAGPYQGMERSACRQALVQKLQEEGLLEKAEPYRYSLGHCQRCRTVVEPLASEQWFVRMEHLARPAIQAVKEGRLRFIPARFSRVCLHWLENIKDWCISRQLWWGHRIPVWYCADCGGVTVAVEEPKKCSHCSSARLRQDPDVLDTWFSSALWPFSTLGWPEDAPDFRYFYPTTVMETAYDILFFWVARMVMMGLENTGELPFHTVYIHGLIRDPHGEKMSKVRGNVVNPLDLVDKYGTDALRFALTTGNTPGNDMRLTPQRLEMGRNFANKLWNASRFVLASLKGEKAPPLGQPRHREDRWILSRLECATEHVDSFMEEFQFGEAERVIYEFLWGEFCDWYIEMAKVRLRHSKEPLPVLVHCLERGLRLLHPFMPFITEEVWQNLKGHLPGEGLPPALIVAPSPAPRPELLDAEAEEGMGWVIEVVQAIRNIRTEHKVPASQWVEALVRSPAGAPLAQEREAIQTLARARPLSFLAPGAPLPSPDKAAVRVWSRGEVVLPLVEVGQRGDEREKVLKEIAFLEEQSARLEARLKDEAFLSKAPAEVIEREREKLAAYKEKLGRLKAQVSP